MKCDTERKDGDPDHGPCQCDATRFENDDGKYYKWCDKCFAALSNQNAIGRLIPKEEFIVAQIMDK